MVCHCMLIETPSSGLVLVDTGFGSQDIADPKRRIGASFIALTRPSLDPRQIARAQVEALGFEVGDVRHILLTHMDLDHAGGLGDFPGAKVHLMTAELEAALNRPTIREKNRYKSEQWAHGPTWVPHHPTAGERWLGFECVRDLVGLPPEILMVPLSGHTRGHAAIAVQSVGQWQMHCGDAYFHFGELEPTYHCPSGLKNFQRLMAISREEQQANLHRLRELRAQHSDEVRLFSAHDPTEFSRSLES